MLQAMQFDDFVWPHNPKTYTIRFSRGLTVRKQPFGTYTVEDQGVTARVMEGSGEFFGPGAYETFRQLASRYYRTKPGVLLHPLWQSSSVYFDRLELLEEPGEDHVRYAFRFVESPEEPTKSADAAQNAARLGAGQTLWALARQHGTSTQAILARNPQLATCNDAQPGEVVYLP